MNTPMLSVEKVSSTDEPIAGSRPGRSQQQRHEHARSACRRAGSAGIASIIVSPSSQPVGAVAVEQPGQRPGDAAPDQPVDRRDQQFLADQPADVAARSPGRARASGSPASSSGCRSCRRSRPRSASAQPAPRPARSSSSKSADHPRREERGAEVQRQPQPAVARRVPDRREQVLLLAQAGRSSMSALALLADDVDHLVDRQPADQVAVRSRPPAPTPGRSARTPAPPRRRRRGRAAPARRAS